MRVVKKFNKSLTNGQRALKQIINTLIEAGAEDIVAYDVKGVSDITDYVVICSSRSEKHSQGIWNRLDRDLSSIIKPRAVEGYKSGSWVLADFYDYVIHILTKPMRDFYRLEDLWFAAKQCYPKIRRRKRQKH